MKFFVAFVALVAVATAYPEVRQKRGILAYSAPSAVISGPSGTIATSSAWAAPAGIVSAHGLVAPGVVAARSILAPGAATILAAPGAHHVLAAPGVTAGTVIAPGTTLVGPSTNGAPGAVITNNGLFGTQILV